MSYTIKTAIANKSNYGSKRSTSGIKYIVIHYTGNDGDTDENNGKYFQNNVVSASAHYFVDDDSVTQSVPDDYIAYAVGGNYGGGSLYGKATNANTLSVELCDTVKNGTVYPSAKTIENAVAFVKEKMKQYNIPQSNVIRHYDVNGKKCPAYWVDDTKWKSEFWNKLSATAEWIKDSTGWWYKHADGSYTKSDWEKIDGYWYYFNGSGYMVTGWQKVNNLWYYMDGSGKMLTGWQQINGSWYYLKDNGAMIENDWLQDGGKWYYLKDGGAMAKDEILTIGGKQYVFLADGHMGLTNSSGALS